LRRRRRGGCPAPCLRWPERSESARSRRSNLAAIAAARDVIYMENQYFAARKTSLKRIAARLREADGPEVVIVLPRSSESRLEQERWTALANC